MKKTIKTFAIGIIATSFLFTSCKKGDTGPQGNAGTNGSNGVANIQVQNYSYLQFSTASPYNIFISDPLITSQVFTSGTVQVFIQNTTSTSLWEAAPDGYFFPLYVQSGSIYIGSPTNWTAVGNSYNVKIVTIPPAMVKPAVNTHDYNQLKSAYGLKD